MNAKLPEVVVTTARSYSSQFVKSSTVLQDPEAETLSQIQKTVELCVALLFTLRKPHASRRASVNPSWT